MGCDVVRVRLRLRLIRVLAAPVGAPGELVVEVESAARRPRCAACGFCSRRVHDRRRRKVRDLEVSGRPTTLVWHRRRFACDNCGERRLEDRREFEGRLTRRLARRPAADAGVMPVSAVARCCGLGRHVVMALVRSWSDPVAGRRRGRRGRVLVVDETSMRERRRYVTVIVHLWSRHPYSPCRHVAPRPRPLRCRSPLDELDPAAAYPAIPQTRRRHDLEHHRRLVRSPMCSRSGKEPDIVPVAEMLHHWINEIARWWRADRPILGRHRHPSTLRNRHQLACLPGTLKARGHSRSGNAKNLRRLKGRHEAPLMFEAPGNRLTFEPPTDSAEPDARD